MMLIQPLTERSKVVTNQLPEYDEWQIYNRTLTGGQNGLRIQSIRISTSNVKIILFRDSLNFKFMRGLTFLLIHRQILLQEYVIKCSKMYLYSP